MSEDARTRYIENVRPADGPLVGEGRVIEPPPAPERKSSIRTYDPSQVKMTFNGVELEGFMNDRFFEVEVEGGVETTPLKVSFTGTCELTIPVLWNPKRWRRRLFRKKRMALRLRRGRGACSS